ncbi:hypothetical protein DPMN_193072 [Dreissena polymorpha]|uniref:Uncharacterized protein n=1 Tax=Dreissena polymorpha TaxID=45954 RepID=A0A9D3Y2R0_DREPO|nr:hypothetical protein DPMN_193072 [Dreissena polymorpha]
MFHVGITVMCISEYQYIPKFLFQYPFMSKEYKQRVHFEHQRGGTSASDLQWVPSVRYVVSFRLLNEERRNRESSVTKDLITRTEACIVSLTKGWVESLNTVLAGKLVEGLICVRRSSKNKGYQKLQSIIKDDI